MLKLSIILVIFTILKLCKTQYFIQQQQSKQLQQNKHPQQVQPQQQFSYNTVQQIPPVACPNYFQYLQNGPQYFGILTLPSISDNIDLVIHFSQRQPLQTNYYGKISLFEDRLTTLNRVQTRQPISYRIEFPSTTEVPKLTKITVNGQDICHSDDYPPPRTQLYLNHKLATKTQTFLQSTNVPRTQLVFNQPKPDDNFISYQGNSSNPQVTFLQSLKPIAQLIPELRSQSPANNNQVISQNAQCGEAASISAFVFGGEQLTRGQHPWLTAIFMKSAGLRFLCGGTLLTQRTVITAAHCFKIYGNIRANRLVVNVGRYNLEDYNEQNFQIRELQNLIIHPEFSSNVFPDADLAILHLQQPVEYSNIIRPICLWAEPDDSGLIVGSTGVVAGWGADENGRPFTPVPKKVNTNIVSESDCLRSSQVYIGLTSPRTICAGNRDGSGPCVGDSGSGLIINRNGRWFLRGVVSAGQTKQQKCDLLEYVVFCDVAKHSQWVQNNLL